MAQFKHLSLSERIAIQRLLSFHNGLGVIARELGRDRKTIAREILQNRTSVYSGTMGSPKNNCARLKGCQVRHLCERCLNRRGLCHLCGPCNELCKNYVPARCKRLEHPPFCCNGCPKQRNCTIRRHVYDAEKAHAKTLARLKDVRCGILLSQTELEHTDRLVSPLLKKGQSVHHIYLNHADEVFCSERTLYSLIGSNRLTARNLDLRLTVRRRVKHPKPEHKVDRTCRRGRTYAEFLNFISVRPDTPVVQMDSVIGREDSLKVLLTLFLPQAQFLLCRIRDFNTARSVLEVFDTLEQTLGSEAFRRLFPVILTDNGSEFSNPVALERDGRTRIFYCDPMQSNQKSSIERAHEFIRMVRPKGSSFDDLRQSDIDRLCSHINSYRRDSLMGKCPIDAFVFLYGPGILESLGIQKIEADEIFLTPRLLP